VPFICIEITKRAATISALVVAAGIASLAVTTASSHGASRESDKYALELARDACKVHDFRQFFFLFSQSNAVRLQYVAPKVSYAVLDQRGNTQSKAVYDAGHYRRFPIQTMDYDLKPTEPAVAGDEGEYIDLEFNQSQSNVYSVEWARVHYDGKTEGEEGRGNMLDANGKPVPKGTHPVADGQLLFQPTADCWELSEDIRWDRKK
jgi:hypothetical protein